MKKIFIYKLFFTSLFFFTSCSSKDSLQSYFVNHQEDSAFISVDIPISFLNNEKIDFSEDQTKAINSINKLNVIAYSLADGNLDEFNSQLFSVKNILKLSLITWQLTSSLRSLIIGMISVPIISFRLSLVGIINDSAINQAVEPLIFFLARYA